MSVFKRSTEKNSLDTPVAPIPSRTRVMSDATVFGRGMKIKGRIRAREEVRINGEISGNLDVKGTVIVDTDGSVKADIHADEVIIRGKVTGNLICAKAAIEPGGELSGDVSSPRMLLADGAIFKGKIDMAPKDGESATGKKSPSGARQKLT